jgi:hypothetical protein
MLCWPTKDLSAMTSAAQLAANRRNAQFSTGPHTREGKALVSRNAVSFGLFSTRDFVRPDEFADYELLRDSLLEELRPEGILELTHASEILSATWRLRRCGILEASFSGSALSSTPDPMANPEAAKLQAAIDRARTQAYNMLRRATAALHELQADSQPAPADPLRIPAAKQTQSAPPASSVPDSLVPRNSPCPCHSGQKYKRCCGRNSPGVFSAAAQV